MLTNIRQALKSSVSVWTALIVSLNTVFGIAGYSKQFVSISWSVQTLWVFLIFNVVAIFILFVAFSITRVYSDNRNLRRANESLHKELEESRESIVRGFMKIGKHSYMVSEFNEDTGKLTYEGRRCMLMSCATLQGIFQEITKHSEPLVKNLGYEMGKEFGKRFRQYLKSEYPTTDLEIDLQIEKWCKYDMNAGLGVFENKVVINSGEIISGEIQLKYSFLTEDRSCEDKNLCRFMEGYIEGVLNRIGNRRDDVIRVEHKYCDLDYPGKPNLGCRFLITDSRQDLASSNLVSNNSST